jgi:hypothetical protein
MRDAAPTILFNEDRDFVAADVRARARARGVSAADNSTANSAAIDNLQL